MEPQQRPDKSPGSMGIPGWIAIIVLAGFLVGAMAYAVHAWDALPGVQISALGWIFMVLGAVLTLVTGGGLMALVFYSSRHGRDI
jgi:hypothetical protein